MIIDSHQHFWNYNEKRDAWINESMEILKKDFLPHDLEPILKQNKIDGCIAVQADQSEEETEFLLKCASENKFIKGVVGWVDLCSENLESRLSYFSNNPLFKGVRHIVQAENINYLRKKDVEKGIGKLSKFNLTYDLLITTEQIKSAISLNSSSLKPLVVQAGVPNLIPEVMNGLSVSNGIPFLLQVMFDLPNEACASFPVTLKDLRSSNIKCVSVPPEKILKPFSVNLSDKTFAFLITFLV